LTALGGPETIRECASTYSVRYLKSRRSLQVPESAKLLDCAERYEAAGIGRKEFKIKNLL